MQLLNTQDATVYEIYDIAYDNYGDPVFLIYKNKQWKLEEASHFTPNYELVFNQGEDAYLVDGKLFQKKTEQQRSTQERPKRRLFVDM